MASDKKNDAALSVFIAKKNQIDAMLARLTALSAENFGVQPDDVTWDHVGVLDNYAKLLRDITDSTFREGGPAE